MKALIAMSGGVDSSVAALLTKQKGFECIGCTMKLFENNDVTAERTCCSLDDVEDARSVAMRIGMPYYVFNFKDEFGEKVMKKFACSYLEGRTPNPCIDCNRYLKFGRLHDRAKELGCDYVVTGHYARIERSEDGLYHLKKALDPAKDQSYVLYSMTQAELGTTLFPLGGMSKTEVRKVAEENGFVNADKAESQDICFAPDGDYAGAVERIMGISSEEGDFVDASGNIIGRHKGIIHYTIGQRKGLGISSSEPYYVCRICPDDNTVVLGRTEELMSREAVVRDINWISGTAPDREFRCSVKIRYRHKEQRATVNPRGKDSAIVTFDEPQRAITPGQAAVFYDEDDVLGGGVIE